MTRREAYQAVLTALAAVPREDRLPMLDDARRLVLNDARPSNTRSLSTLARNRARVLRAGRAEILGALSLPSERWGDCERDA